jgi:hypothetical protein
MNPHSLPADVSQLDEVEILGVVDSETPECSEALPRFPVDLGLAATTWLRKAMKASH